jgi:hypothetical protein
LIRYVHGMASVVAFTEGHGGPSGIELRHISNIA